MAQIRHIIIYGCVDLTHTASSSIIAVATVGSVKPHLKLVGAILNHLFTLLDEYFRHIRRVAVMDIVSVPGADVKAIFHAEVAGGLPEIAGDIGSFAGIVTSPRYIVVGGGGGPEAESVVVFHYGYTALHAGSFDSLKPLTGIGHRRWGEYRGVGVASTPFEAGEGVHAEMEEAVKLGFVPKHLSLCRDGKHGSGFVVGIGRPFVDKSYLRWKESRRT